MIYKINRCMYSILYLFFTIPIYLVAYQILRIIHCSRYFLIQFPNCIYVYTSINLKRETSAREGMPLTCQFKAQYYVSTRIIQQMLSFGLCHYVYIYIYTSKPFLGCDGTIKESMHYVI